MKRNSVNAVENIVELLECIKEQGRHMNMSHESMLRLQSKIDYEVMCFNERMRPRFAMNRSDPIESIRLVYDLTTTDPPTLQVNLGEWFKNIVETDEILSYF